MLLVVRTDKRLALIVRIGDGRPRNIRLSRAAVEENRRADARADTIARKPLGERICMEACQIVRCDAETAHVHLAVRQRGIRMLLHAYEIVRICRAELVGKADAHGEGGNALPGACVDGGVFRRNRAALRRCLSRAVHEVDARSCAEGCALSCDGDRADERTAVRRIIGAYGDIRPRRLCRRVRDLRRGRSADDICVDGSAYYSAHSCDAGIDEEGILRVRRRGGDSDPAIRIFLATRRKAVQSGECAECQRRVVEFAMIQSVLDRGCRIRILRMGNNLRSSAGDLCIRMRTDDVCADRDTGGGALCRCCELTGVVLYAVVARRRDDGVLSGRHLRAVRDLRAGIVINLVDGDRAGNGDALAARGNAHADVEDVQVALGIRDNIRRMYLPAADDGIGVGIEKVDGNAGADRRTFGRPRADDGKGACRQFAVRLYRDIPRRFARFCLNVGTDDLRRRILIDIGDRCRPRKCDTTARAGDIECNGIQRALVFGVHVHHAALGETDLRTADACRILLSEQGVESDGSAYCTALRGGRDTADGGILTRLVKCCHTDGLRAPDLCVDHPPLRHLILRNLRAGIVFPDVDGDGAADGCLCPCGNPCCQRLNAADVLRVEVYDAVVRERQSAAAQCCRRIVVDHVDGGGKPCRHTCAARRDTDLSRDVDEEALRECVRLQFLRLDRAVLDDRRGLIVRRDDRGGTCCCDAATARYARRYVYGTGIGDTLHVKPLCALQLQVAALYARREVILNHADTNADPRRCRCAAARRSGDACRRRDDGAAAAVRQIAVLIDRKGAVALALCKILLILVTRGLDTALLEILLICARLVFVVRTDICAVCRQRDPRELRRRLVREVVHGKAARHRGRMFGAGGSADADRCADLRHSGNSFVRERTNIAQCARILACLCDVRVHVIPQIGYGDDRAHRIRAFAAEDKPRTHTARHLRIRTDGAIGKSRFLYARECRSVRRRIDVIIPHLRQRDRSALVVRQRNGSSGGCHRFSACFHDRQSERGGDGRTFLNGDVFDAVRAFDAIVRHERQNVAMSLHVDARRTRNAGVRAVFVLALRGGFPRDRQCAAPCARKGGVLCADGEVFHGCGRCRIFRQGDIRPLHLCRRRHLAEVDRGAARQIEGKRRLFLIKSEVLDRVDRNRLFFRLFF